MEPLFILIFSLFAITYIYHLIAQKKGFQNTFLKAEKYPIKDYALAILTIAYFPVFQLMYCKDINLTKILQVSFSVLYLAVPLLFIGRGRKIYIAAVLLVLLKFSVPQLFHQYMYEAPMPEGGFFAMFESPTSESIEFIKTYLTLDILSNFLMISLAPITWLILLNKGEKITYKDKLNVQNILCALAFILASFTFKNFTHAPYYEYLRMKEIHQEKFEKFTESIEKRKNDKNLFSEVEIINTEPSIDDNQTFVLIIGESTGRNHMGLYGYYRNTNPKLASISNELFMFNDVVSPHPHTIPALKKVLTFADFENMDLYYSQGNILELYKKAGFKTFWLSNQYFEGDFENETTAIAKMSDKYVFVNKNKQKSTFDDALQTPLEDALKDKASKKLIIVHLMGTHGNYADRYPKAFSTYTNETIRIKGKPFLVNSGWGKERINEYDNAVKFNDKVVFDMINAVKKHTSYSSVLYFSDHGEEMYDCLPWASHNEANATPFMYEIPFLLWCSEDYKKMNSEKIKLIKAAKNRAYQTDDLIHTFLDLTNIRVKNYMAHKSLFSASFKKEKRIMGLSDYDQEKGKYDFNRKMLQKNVNPEDLIATKGITKPLNFEETKALILANKNWATLLKNQAETKGVTFESLLNEEVEWAMKQ